VATDPLTQQGLELIEDESIDWALHDQGIEILREAVAQGEASAPMALARGLVKRGQLDEAAALLEPIVRNGRFDLAGFLAHNLDELNDTERAEHFYLMAIEHGGFEALNDYGGFLVTEERYAEAAKVYQRAIAEGDPLAPGNLVNLVAEGLGDLGKALQLGERYLDPAKPSTYSALAAVQARRGDLDEAEYLYEEAIGLDAPGAHLHFAWFLEEHREDLIAAERELWNARDSNEPGWGFQLGKFLFGRGRYDDAAAVLTFAAHWGDLAAKEFFEENYEEAEES
jgi:Tfp pilus assembly protein PilF